MGLSNKFADELEQVDVIIVGGGSAGCVVAGRVAAAAPDLHVLLIEGGRDNYKSPLIVNPFAFIKNIEPEAKHALFFQAAKSEHVGGRELIVPTGGVLGGGSSINFMMYTRGHRSDFESWKTLGWGPDDMLPFFNKAETYHGTGSAARHGSSGPVQVSDGTYRNQDLTTDYIRAVNALGYPETADLQDMETMDAVSRHRRFINQAGDRSDTAHAYIHPLLRDGEHPNLHVLVEHQVTRVLFDDGNRAIGVELVANPLFQPSSASSVPAPSGTSSYYTARSRRSAVVLSAGALCTPLILERSGIGAAAVLERAGVALKVDLPAVGENLQDHHMLMMPYRSSQAADATGNAAVLTTLDQIPDMAEKLDADGKRGWNSIEASAKLRPTAREVDALGSRFKEAWERDFLPTPGRGLMQLSIAAGFPGPADEPGCENICAAAFTLYPYSRGSVHITGPWASDGRPAFASGIFSDAPGFDVAAACWMYKKAREVFRRLDTYRGEVAYGHPVFREGSGAALLRLPVAGPSLVQAAGGIDQVADLEYSAADDAAVEAYVRNSIQTTWHTLGTVRMGPRDAPENPGPRGAVDAHLNVYGVTGLKVVDLSIVPENIGGNTNMTAIGIGEKGADILLRELAISQD